MVIIAIIIGLVVLSVIVIVHELGHFLTAKMVGVRVEELGLGYPPRIFGVRRGETLYSLNAIPFGGFTKMTGEEDPSEPRSLASKGIGTRFLVLSAGSIMNLLLTLLLFSIVFMIPRNVVTEPVVVANVAPNSPASMAGIETGDTILSVNNRSVHNISDLQRYIHLNLGQDTTMLIGRGDSTTREIQVVPRWKPPEGQGAIGVELDLEVARLNRTTVSQSYPFWKAIPLGVSASIETIILYKNGVVSIITGAAPAVLTGPVGIVQLTGEVAIKAGLSSMLEFAAFLSLIIGIFNLFPIPALDGGRIAFVLLEWVRRGKRVSPKAEGLVHLIGFFMLIAVLVLITYQDIMRIISGESLIP